MRGGSEREVDVFPIGGGIGLVGNCSGLLRVSHPMIIWTSSIPRLRFVYQQGELSMKKFGLFLMILAVVALERGDEPSRLDQRLHL